MPRSKTTRRRESLDDEESGRMSPTFPVRKQAPPPFEFMVVRILALNDTHAKVAYAKDSVVPEHIKETYAASIDPRRPCVALEDGRWQLTWLAELLPVDQVRQAVPDLLRDFERKRRRRA